MARRQFTDLFQWYNQSAREAWRSDNPEMQRLGAIYRDISYTSNENTDAIQTLAIEGEKLAKVLGEPYWELMFRWYGYYSSPDFGSVTQNLVQLVVDLSHPDYQDCPFGARIYMELLYAYTRTDTLGYATEILDGVDYVLANFALDIESYLRLLGLRVTVYLEQRQWQLAYFAGQDYLQQAEELQDTNNIINAANQQLDILLKMGAPMPALATTERMSSHIRRIRHPSMTKTYHFWQAAIYDWIGDKEKRASVQKDIDTLKDVVYYHLGIYSVVKDYELNRNMDEQLSLLLRLSKPSSNFGKSASEMEYRLRYYARLKEASIWNRWMHFGSEYSFIKQFVQRYPRFRDLPWLIFIPSVILGLFLIYGIGMWMDTIGRQVQKIRQEIEKQIQDSTARMDYEARLARIDAGDMTHLS